MSVFNRSKRNREVEATHFANGEEIPCRNGHRWDGELPPPVDKDVHEFQNTFLMGRVCDCKKMVYGEMDCGCSTKRWEIKIIPNEV